MASAQGSSSVAANASNVNVLSGESIENIPVASGMVALVRLWLSGAAAGLVARLKVGEREPLQDSEVGASNNNPPNWTDDLVLPGALGRPGEKIALRVDNTTAGAITIYWRLQVNMVPVSVARRMVGMF